MISFTFKVKNQKLECLYDGIVADSINYLDAVFLFSEEWNGLQKYAHFANGDKKYEMIIIDDEIRAERGLNLTEGIWKVNLHGSILEDGEIKTRITTNEVQIYVEKSGVMDGDPFPDVIPSIGEQIVSEATQAAEDAKLYRNEAKQSENGADDSADIATEKAAIATEKADEATQAAESAKAVASGLPERVSEYISDHKEELKGEPGYTPIKGIDYFDGEPGAPGKDAEPYDDTEIRAELTSQNENIAKLDGEVSELNDGLAKKLDKPTSGIAVGKYFRVASVDELGNPVLEAVELPIATNNRVGVIKPSSSGFAINESSGLLNISNPATSSIDNRLSNRAITASTLDYAVKSALCDGKGQAYTEAEQLSARQRLGIGDWETILDITVDEPIGITPWALLPKPYKKYRALSIANSSGVATGSFSYFQIGVSQSILNSIVELPFANNGNKGGFGIADIENHYCVRVLNGNTISNTASVGAYTFDFDNWQDFIYYRIYTNSGATIPKGVRIILQGSM